MKLIQQLQNLIKEEESTLLVFTNASSETNYEEYNKGYNQAKKLILNRLKELLAKLNQE